MSVSEDVANYLKVVKFGYPGWIPVQVEITAAMWFKHGVELENIVLSHPTLFPDYEQGDFARIMLAKSHRQGRWTDAWGITWDNAVEGLGAAPVAALAPLGDWGMWHDYEAPDSPNYDRFGDPINWGERRNAAERSRAEGYLAKGSLYHGAMYMRLWYLRGFENLMMDIATRDSRLDALIELLLKHNVRQVDKWIEIGVDMLCFGDDLGHQRGLPMSPSDWRTYLKPCFAEMFGRCRESDVLVYLHTDGYILDIIPDLIACGVDILNLQVRPNTLEGLRQRCQGKVAVDLMLDAQIFPFASRCQIEDHIEQAIDTLALPEGGLMLYVHFEPGFPLENAESICDALEKRGCRGIQVPDSRKAPLCANMSDTTLLDNLG